MNLESKLQELFPPVVIDEATEQRILDKVKEANSNECQDCGHAIDGHGKDGCIDIMADMRFCFCKKNKAVDFINLHYAGTKK